MGADYISNVYVSVGGLSCLGKVSGNSVRLAVQAGKCHLKDPGVGLQWLLLLFLRLHSENVAVQAPGLKSAAGEHLVAVVVEAAEVVFDAEKAVFAAAASPAGTKAFARAGYFAVN